MNMLRHDNIPVHEEFETNSHIFQALNEQIAQISGREVWLATVTAERYEMGVPGFLKAVEMAGHMTNLSR